MLISFVSNYINHHQIPFCDSMCAQLRELPGKNTFLFLQTEVMAEERRTMGWQAQERPDYVHCWYEEPEVCRDIVRDSDVVLFGGCDDESYIADRLQSGKPVIRISERLYKTGQWKAISPRGLLKKYHDHTRYRHVPVYLLCAGAYVASDFRIIHAYSGKRYRWGYFPETRHYDLTQLFAGKSAPDAAPVILWAGRFLDWKHPELAVETARFLAERGLNFHMEIIGGGDLATTIEKLIDRYHLQEKVTLRGFCTPREVREAMERADVYLFTSDRQEGWGAVLNEAMNSGCAVVADHMIGAAPYLIRQGENGFVYDDRRREQLFAYAERLVRDAGLRRRLGTAAYHTISDTWNAENAARELLRLCAREGLCGCGRQQDIYALLDRDAESIPPDGPVSAAPVLREKYHE